MSEADIKLQLIRLIDNQKGQTLRDLYDLILKRIYQKSEGEDSPTALELGYKEMSEDKEREQDAFLWIEGTLHTEDL